MGTNVDFAGIVDALPELVLSLLSDGRSTFANRRCCEYAGLRPDEAMDHGWQAMIHPDDITDFQRVWADIVRSDAPGEVDARLRRFDGEYRWFSFRFGRLPDGADGTASWCASATYADERGVDAAPDRRLRRFLDMVPTQVLFMTPTFEVEFVNRQVQTYYGKTLEELQAWDSGPVHPDDVPMTFERLDRLTRLEEPFDGQTRMRRADGEYRWMHSRMVPTRDADGNIVRYCSVQNEVHVLKNAQDLLAGEVQVLEMVARGSPLPEILDALSRLVEQICGGSFCSILIVAPDRAHFRVGAGPSLPDAYNEILDGKTFDPGYGPCSLSIVEKTPIITADLANDPRWAGSVWPSLMKEYGYASCWSTPILSASGEASGIFAIYRREPVGPNPEEQELIDRFTKIAGISIDKVQADEALRSSESELRRAHVQLAEGQRLSKTGSFTWDALADEHDWSPEISRIFGFDPDARLTMPMIQAAIHPDDMTEVAQLIGGATDGRDFDLVFRIVTREGELRYAHVVGHRIEHITDRPVFVGALQDVTESKVAEAELRRANSYLTAAQRLSRTGSFTWDVVAEDSIWSDEMYRIFDVADATDSGINIVRRAIHPNDAPILDTLPERLGEASDFDVEFRIVTASGLKHVHTVAHRVDETVDRPIFVGAAQDITERRLTEERLDRARTELAHVSRVTALSALTASIAHEVNQPLAGIVTNASTCLRMLAANPPNVDGAQATAQRTIRDANRASEVIKRLRALFARRPSGGEPVDLNNAAREVMALSSSELQRARVVLQTDFADDLPTIRGDRVQLQQVILNLVLNAAQAMRTIDDWPRDLRVSTAFDDKGQILLSVRDCGVGAEVEHLEELFNAFYTTKSDGMGVGLSVSRFIVEAHGGRLWAIANDGPGLTFSFSLSVEPDTKVLPTP